MEVDGVGIGNSSHHTVDIEVELWDCSGDHKYTNDLFLFSEHLHNFECYYCVELLSRDLPAQCSQ